MTEKVAEKTTDTAPAPVTGGEVEKSFTQGEVNAMIATKGRRYMDQLLGELGYDNADALKLAIGKAKEAEAAQMTELQKVQIVAEEARLKQKAAEDKAMKTVELANRRMMRAAVLVEAAKGEYHVRPEAMADLWLVIETQMLDKLAIDDEGNVTGMDKAIQAALKDRSHWTLVASPGIGTPQPAPRKTPPKAAPDQRRIVRM